MFIQFCNNNMNNAIKLLRSTLYYVFTFLFPLGVTSGDPVAKFLGDFHFHLHFSLFLMGTLALSLFY